MMCLPSETVEETNFPFVSDGQLEIASGLGIGAMSISPVSTGIHLRSRIGPRILHGLCL